MSTPLVTATHDYTIEHYMKKFTIITMSALIITLHAFTCCGLCAENNSAIGFVRYDNELSSWYVYFIAVYKDNNYLDSFEESKTLGMQRFSEIYLNKRYNVIDDKGKSHKVSHISHSIYDYSGVKISIDNDAKMNKNNLFIFVSSQAANDSENNNYGTCQLDDDDKLKIINELNNIYNIHNKKLSSQNCSQVTDVKQNTFLLEFSGYLSGNHGCIYYANYTPIIENNSDMEARQNIAIAYNIKAKKIFWKNDQVECDCKTDIIGIFDFNSDGDIDIMISNSFYESSTYEIIDTANLNKTLFKSQYRSGDDIVEVYNDGARP